MKTRLYFIAILAASLYCDMRKIAALGVDDVGKEYAFAKGIVEGVPVENVNCEGCVLFGNVECSRLCALTHRVVTW